MRSQLDMYDHTQDILMEGWAELEPGVIDWEAIRAYTEGHCGSLAYCLNQETGWDMCVLTDNYKEQRGFGYAAVHMAVIHPDGSIVDIEGKTPRAKMRERWSAHITKTTPEEFIAACDKGLWIPYPEVELTQTFVEPLLKEIA